MNKPLIEPKFVGARFNDHTIPLELLKDIAVLEEFVIAVAKWKYVQEHDRIRVPKGFTEPLKISLSTIKEGSAIAAIAFKYEDPRAGFLPAANEDYFFKAIQAIGNAIDAAEHGEPINNHLPAELLGYFDRFGRGLREGEALEFWPDQARPARLTKLTRRQLLLASQNDELTDEVVIRGRVPELDQPKLTCEVEGADGRRITVKFDQMMLDTVLEATRGYRSGVKVSISGIGRFDRLERLQLVEATEEVVIIDATDPLARLDELRLLKPGWLDGTGKVPSKTEFDWLEDFFLNHYPSSLPTPYIYPTEDGGILLEWRIGTFDISLEIDMHKKTAEYHSLETNTGNEEFKELLMDKEGILAITNTISTAAVKAAEQ